MEDNPEINAKENRIEVVRVNSESVEFDQVASLVQNPSNEAAENVKGFHEEAITLQVDQSKYQLGDLAHYDKKPSDKEVVSSLRGSLKSTPHSVANKARSKKNENKGSGWKVWLPILSVVTIFFIVVIVVSVKNSPDPEKGKKYAMKFIRQRYVMNIYQSYITNINCFVTILFISETLFKVENQNQA